MNNMIAKNNNLGNSWGLVKQVGPGGSVALRGPTAINGQARTWIDPRGFDKPTSGLNRNVGKRVPSVTVNNFQKFVKGGKTVIDPLSGGLRASDRQIITTDREKKAVKKATSATTAQTGAVGATEVGNSNVSLPAFGGVAARRRAEAAEQRRRNANATPLGGSNSSGSPAFPSTASGTGSFTSAPGGQGVDNVDDFFINNPQFRPSSSGGSSSVGWPSSGSSYRPPSSASSRGSSRPPTPKKKKPLMSEVKKK